MEEDDNEQAKIVNVLFVFAMLWFLDAGQYDCLRFFHTSLSVGTEGAAKKIKM